MTDHDRAFNEGCDARIVGLPIEQCPYLRKSPAYSFWREGWRYTHRHHGMDCLRVTKRLPRPLPPVNGMAKQQ